MNYASPTRNRWLATALAALLLLFVAALLVPALFVPTLRAGNEVMAELQFEGKTKVEKTSGVWIDGQYVGYLKELKGSKKVLLLPGEHDVTVRQDGYQDFTQRLTLQPGEKRLVAVTMQKAATGPMPNITAQVKIAVNPSRAAVFVDGLFVGHVGEFQGVGRGMLVAPGDHKIKIALPGYKTFETEINPQAKQKVEVKTDLLKDDVPLADPSLTNGNVPTQPAPPPPPQPPPQR